MLNQVFVFGCFHADLHPANLFVLPGDAIGYVDFGIVGQLPDALRAVADPVRLAALPGRRRGGHPASCCAGWRPRLGDRRRRARQRLVRIHEAFLYDLGRRLRRRPRPLAPPGARRGRRGRGRHREPLLPARRRRDADGAPARADPRARRRGLPEDAGHPRAPCATSWPRTTTCPRHARRFFERLLRQQGADWLDPRQALDRALRRRPPGAAGRWTSSSCSRRRRP